MRLTNELSSLYPYEDTEARVRERAAYVAGRLCEPTECEIAAVAESIRILCKDGMTARRIAAIALRASRKAVTDEQES